MMAAYTQTIIAQTNLGLLTLIEGTAGKTARLRYLCVALAANGTVQLKSGPTALTGAIPVLASVPLILDLADPQASEVALAAPANGGIDIVTTQIGSGFAILEKL